MGTPVLDSEEFAERLRARDPDAFRAVVDAYLDQVHRAARGAGLDPEQAREATQATFAAFFDAAARFEGRSRVRTFLFGVLYRKLAEMRRGFQRDRRHDEIDEALDRRFDADGAWLRPPLDADRALYGEEIVSLTAECLEGVPERQRLAFILREVEGLSSKELCNSLDVTRTHLGVMLFRARNRLRECLEGKGIFGAG